MKIGDDKVNIDRFEDKFIIKKSKVLEILREVQNHLEPAYPDNRTTYTLVDSVYFDSPELDFVKQHLKGKNGRIKLRVRTYGPEGEWEHDHYLENKSKTDGRSNKIRLHLNDKKMLQVVDERHVEIDDKLKKLNKLNEENLNKSASLFNHAFITYKAEPVVEITYKRFAYEKGKLRITIDQDIRVKMLRDFPLEHAKEWANGDMWKELQDYVERFHNQDNAVLEIKHEKDYPDWLKKIVDDNKLEETHFSKYVWSIGNIFKNILKFNK